MNVTDLFRQWQTHTISTKEKHITATNDCRIKLIMNYELGIMNVTDLSRQWQTHPIKTKEKHITATNDCRVVTL